MGERRFWQGLERRHPIDAGWTEILHRVHQSVLVTPTSPRSSWTAPCRRTRRTPAKSSSNGCTCDHKTLERNWSMKTTVHKEVHS